MSLDALKAQLPTYAKDIKLNLFSVLSSEGAPGLSEPQLAGTALASALATGHATTIAAINAWANELADSTTLTGAKTAAAIMAMNNIYYRSLHLMSESSYGQLPARLRMNAIANPGIPKVDFELFCLAVSAINGCGMCLDAHEKILRQQDLGQEAIQSALRIAAVVNAVAHVLESDAAMVS